MPADWWLTGVSILIDYILYGMDKAVPLSVMAIGGKYAFPDDAMETPDTMTTVYDFKDFTSDLGAHNRIPLGRQLYGRTHANGFCPGSL